MTVAGDAGWAFVAGSLNPHQIGMLLDCFAVLAMTIDKARLGVL